MNDPIKLDWQPRGSVPTAEDYPLFYHFDSAGLVYCPHPTTTTTGSEHKYPWARLRIAAPDEQPEAKEARPCDEWLNKLPEWLKKRAIANIEDQHILDGYNAPCLFAAFLWCDTPEGPAFWSRVDDWFAGRRPLPPNPDDTPKVEAEAKGESPDPLQTWPVVMAVREAMIAASNAPSADAARRWFNDRFLEIKREVSK